MAMLVDVGSAVSYFQFLRDPRHTRNRKHLLVDIIVLSVCAIVCGCDGPTAIQRWASANHIWLAEHLTFANGVPSRDCIRRLLIALQPEAFQRCFQDWIAHAAAFDGADRLIAIDGKTCRGSHDAANNLGPLHIVSAWASEEGIALGQVATDGKSNEITAIPVLLDQIDIEGAIVTIDAMGCQKDIVEKIVAGKGVAVIAVKDNQPKWMDAIRSHFHKHIERDLEDLRYRSYESVDKSHGRIDERTYYICATPADFGPAADWPKVKAIGYAMRWTQHADGSQTCEVRYYLATRYLSGKRFAEAVRGHWGIEAMHWVLDVTFREDESRTRERTLANNLSWLRRFAVTLLKRHPLKDSIKGKMLRCAYNPAFLAEVLALNDV